MDEAISILLLPPITSPGDVRVRRKERMEAACLPGHIPRMTTKQNAYKISPKTPAIKIKKTF
jgi:hypothetical protein